MKLISLLIYNEYERNRYIWEANGKGGKIYVEKDGAVERAGLVRAVPVLALREILPRRSAAERLGEVEIEERDGRHWRRDRQHVQKDLQVSSEIRVQET